MSIFKRGTIYWYKFTFNGEAIRKSSRHSSKGIDSHTDRLHKITRGLTH
jgi:hypothetical protein